MTDQLKQAIEDVGRLLEEKECPCFEDGQKCVGCDRHTCPHSMVDCRICKGTGLDPHYDPLRELFKVEEIVVTEFTGGDVTETPTGRFVPRLDLAETEGALAGAIYVATKDWPFWDKEGPCVWDEPSPNLAATLALKEVLNGS